MPRIGSVNWREAVELTLPGAPVEAVLPVIDERFQIREAGAGGPRFKRRLVGKARAREPLAQIGDLGVGNMQGEGFCGDHASF